MIQWYEETYGKPLQTLLFLIMNLDFLD